MKTDYDNQSEKDHKSPLFLDDNSFEQEDESINASCTVRTSQDVKGTTMPN